MAFTSSPQFQTYKTVNIEFDGYDTFRTGDLAIARDLQIVNMFYDRISQENKERDVRLMKRDGIVATAYSLSKTNTTDVIRGYFNDTDTNTFYWAVNDKVYSVSPDVGTTVRTVATLATSSGQVGFCSFLKSTGTRYVIFTDGTEMWVDDYVAVSCTKVTDIDLPTPHEPSVLYLDGYVFVIKKNTGDIYNSDLDDPFVWAGEVISAEISSDHARRLYRVKNYIVCLGDSSIEYFWDAANASGSPLSRNDSPVNNIGFVTGDAQSGDTVFMVGQHQNQGLAVYAVNGFKADVISNPVVERTLQPFSTTPNSKGNIVLNTKGHIVSSNGHTYYVLVTNQTTWAYEIKDKIWYEWKNSSNTGLSIEASWGMFNGGAYLAIAGQTTISMMSPTAYQDFGVNFTCRYTTESSTFGTMNWKVLNKLALDCSKHSHTGTSNITVKYSYDDWAPASPVVTRYINVFSNSPYIVKLGRFRNISLRFEYTDNYPFFMSRCALDINVQGI